jgi:pimeloyl-ACP methyl ester carboxylesterase
MRFFLDAFTQGASGVLADYLVYAEPWGFDLGRVDVPVRLWYGDDDSLVPLEHGRLLANRLPHAELEVVASAGHLLPHDHVAEMLEALTASPSAA